MWSSVLSTFRYIFLLAWLINGLNSASAQETPVPNQLNQQLVTARIQALRDAGSQEGSETALESYQQILDWLGEADVHAASEKTYLESLNVAPQQESEVRARIEANDYEASGIDPATVSKLGKSKIEDKLTGFRLKLRDTSAAKDTLDRRIAAEQGSAPDIQARFETIDKRLQELPTTIITIEPDIQPSQFEASQWSAVAERSALTAERRSLEARLNSQPVRYSRRKAESAEFALKIDSWQFAVQTLEAELSARAEKLEKKSSVSLDENAPGYEFVQQLVEATTRLRTQRTDLNALLSALKEEDAQVGQIQLSLVEQYDAVQQIVALAQSSASLGHVLMAHWHQADNFRLHLAAAATVDDIGEHVIQRAKYEEQQAALSTTTTEISLQSEMDETMLAAAKDRVRTQRELLTDLITLETEIINLQGRIDRTHHQLGVQFDVYQGFLSSRILWVPSHPTLLFPSPENFKKELSGYVDSLFDLRLSQFTWTKILLLVLILVSIVLRGKMRQGLQYLNTKVGRARDDSIRYTFRALLITLVRSIAVPLLIIILASAIGQSSTVTAPYFSVSLIHLAQTLFLILLLRAACEEDGMAQVHFGWAQSTCMEIYRLTTLLLIWWLPLALVTSFSFTVETDSINAVFGRSFFCLEMLVIGILLSKTLWPKSPESGGYRRLRIVSAVLVISIIFYYIAGAYFGYLYSIKVLYDALVSSLALGIGLIFFYYFMQRWLLIVRRRLRFRELLAARQALDENEERTAEIESDLVPLSESVAQLLKAGTLTLGVAGLAYLWAPLFRALEALQRITLWTVSDTSKGEAILTSITLASLALALFIGVVTFFAARHVPSLVALLLRSQKGSTPGTRYAIVKLLGYLIIGGGFIAILSTLGLRWDRLQWLVAALSVGIGFGLQEIIANFISGLIILFERPIRVGDLITVGESSGEVIRIRIRATTIRDFDGKELLVPNKEFVTGRLLNWTLSDTSIRMVLEVGIAYGSDVRKAKAILEEILVSHEMILDRPEPDVIFREFGDNSLNLIARYFFNDPQQRAYLLSDLHQKVYDAFAEAGIVIAFPQLDVHFDREKGPEALKPLTP
jgi:potassium efflux system protein